MPNHRNPIRTKTCPQVLALLFLAALPTWAQSQSAETATGVPDLSPRVWSKTDQLAFPKRDRQFGQQNQLATSQTGVVTGTTSASAIRAGLEALQQGGSAADAALTTSLTQIALAQGCWVSYAGILTMMYYDAESRQVYCLNAGYDTFQEEREPLTIPVVNSGRTALVPGYMAGVEAAHQRFGRLPFKSLFSPALYYAEEGFTLHSFHEANLDKRREVLMRFAEARAVFVDPETRELYRAGALFRQPLLAQTLRRVSEQGAAYMYAGAWAEKFVDLVQAAGGKVTLEDLRRYRVQWTNPIRIPYAGYEVYTHGLPAQGGVHLAETLNLIEVSGALDGKHYTQSPESFFWLSQFNTVMVLSFLPPVTQKMVFGRETPLTLRKTDAFARELWDKMKAGSFALTQKPDGLGDNHSDAVVAIDQWGNMAAVVHTINTASWGQTGLFVDGVSIPDSASFQQTLLSQVAPGDRLPDPTVPLIVLKDGRPFLAMSSIGSGLHAKTVTSLVNLLAFEQELKPALDAASMHLPAFGNGFIPTQQVFEGDFTDELLEGARKLGLKIEVLPKTLASRAPRGYVVGATIDPQTQQRQAVATQTLNAGALGQP